MFQHLLQLVTICTFQIKVNLIKMTRLNPRRVAPNSLGLPVGRGPT